MLRGVRAHYTRFVDGLAEKDLKAGQLGLAHAYSRSKVRGARGAGGGLPGGGSRGRARGHAAQAHAAPSARATRPFRSSST